MGNNSCTSLDEEDQNPEPMKIAGAHYILKNPMKPPFPDHIRTAAFATGCFWGAEKGFWRLPGVYSTAVGYTAGHTVDPTYEQVCSGKSGHSEAVFVAYDPSKVSYADLLKEYWECHDPTQGNRQGGDRGTQYRSGVYCYDDEQKTLAEKSKQAYEKILVENGFKAITAEIVSEFIFYYAEDYHQQYLAKPGNRQYCSAEPTGHSVPAFETWAPPELQKHKPFLPDSFWKEFGPKPGCTIHCPNEQIVLN